MVGLSERDHDAIKKLRKNRRLFSELETTHSIKLSSVHRDAIVDVLTASGEDLLMREDALTRGKIENVASNINKLLSLLVELRNAPEGSSERKAYEEFSCSAHFVQENATGVEIDDYSKQPFVVDLLQDVLKALGGGAGSGARSRDCEKKRGRKKKHRDHLIGNLAIIYENAGGQVGASYKSNQEKITGPFIRFVIALIEACPKGFRHYYGSDVGGAIRKTFRDWRKEDKRIDELRNGLNRRRLWKHLKPDMLDHYDLSTAATDEELLFLAGLAEDVELAARKTGAKPKTTRDELAALSDLSERVVMDRRVRRLQERLEARKVKK